MTQWKKWAEKSFSCTKKEKKDLPKVQADYFFTLRSQVVGNLKVSLSTSPWEEGF